ncbi:solute carrier family 35 (probable UDP-sugar transporter), member A4, partial [Paragonimus westermani]
FARNMKHENDVVPQGEAEKRSNEPPFPLPIPELPVPLFVWRILLVFAVCLYSSFTIFVHLCEVDGKLPFRPTAVVLLVEFAKLVLSTFMFANAYDLLLWRNTASMSFPNALCLEFRRNYETSRSTRLSDGSLPPSSLTWSQLMFIILPFMVPAVLYAVNNNLGILIQLEMDPATYQVLGNFKILSTAILFRLIIKRKITALQWFALFLLLCAGLVHSYGNLLAKSTSNSITKNATTTTQSTSHLLHITALGILLISLYCILSGMSGVYTEYVMKKRAEMNIHLQNGLLYLFGVILNLMAFVCDVYRSDDQCWNPFKGFTIWTWLLVITQAFSGIFMGFVMKFSTNITRLFIVSSAMLVTTFTSMLVFGLQVNGLFGVSFTFVCVSLYLYHR